MSKAPLIASQPTFAWHWEETPVADRVIPMAVASDPDAMLIDACERQDAGEEGVIDPFWATTWRAARGLDLYLDRLSISGVNVLEVGCGTGHAGYAAAIRGAQVTLTDGVADPLQLVRMTLDRNQIRAEVGILRLGTDRLQGERFRIILGSDVTYLRTLWPELLTTAADHLSDGGELLLSDPYRFISDEFREWLKSHPWNYQEFRIDLPDQPQHPIRVMRLTQK